MRQGKGSSMVGPARKVIIVALVCVLAVGAVVLWLHGRSLRDAEQEAVRSAEPSLSAEKVELAPLTDERLAEARRAAQPVQVRVVGPAVGGVREPDKQAVRTEVTVSEHPLPGPYQGAEVTRETIPTNVSHFEPVPPETTLEVHHLEQAPTDPRTASRQ